MDSFDISRRQALTTLGATGTLALAGCVGGDDDYEEVDPGGTTEDDFDGLRVGVLAALTGPNGPEYGHQALTGFLSGLAYKDGGAGTIPETNDALAIDQDVPIEAADGQVMEFTVGGTDIELYIRDTQDRPRPGDFAATELVNDENVDVLYGLSNSDSLLRVIRHVVRITEVPLFVGTASVAEAMLEDETCDRLVFRATGTSAMSASVGAQYIAAQDNLEKAAIFAEDYSFGHSAVTHYREAFEEEGVEVVTEAGHIDQGGEEIYPRGYTDFREIIEAVEDRGADVIVYGFTAQTGTNFFQDFTTKEDEDGDPQLDVVSMGIIGDMPSRQALGDLAESIQARIPGLEEQLGITGLQIGQILNIVDFGPLCTRYFWNQYDNDINTAFVNGSREAFGVNPDMFTGGSFTAASAIMQALEEEGEVSSDAIVEQVYGMTVEDTPKGENAYQFQIYNNQARSPMTIASVEVRPDPGDDDYSAEDEYWPVQLKPGEPLFKSDMDDVSVPADSPHMNCEL